MQAPSKIVLGTVQFGLEYGVNNVSGKPNDKAIRSILDFAFDNNIRLLDTAEAYGNSQEVIGNYHRLSSNKFEIITKFSAGRKDLSRNLQERIRHDLSVLNIGSLYCYMFHSFNDFRTYFGSYKNEIRELKNAGVIRKFGVSVYTNNEIEELLKEENIDIIQLPFNLLDNSNQRSFVIEKAKKRGIEIHARSVFLQGLFFKNAKELPNKLTSLEPYLAAINKTSKGNNLSLNTLSLNYVMQQKNIDNVLIGVDSVEQLKENIKSLKSEISATVMREIDSINVKETSLLNPSNWN